MSRSHDEDMHCLHTASAWLQQHWFCRYITFLRHLSTFLRRLRLRLLLHTTYYILLPLCHCLTPASQQAVSGFVTSGPRHCFSTRSPRSASGYQPGSRTSAPTITHPPSEQRIRLRIEPVRDSRPAGAQRTAHFVSAVGSESRGGGGVHQCTGPVHPCPRRLADAATLRAQK